MLCPFYFWFKKSKFIDCMTDMMATALTLVITHSTKKDMTKSFMSKSQSMIHIQWKNFLKMNFFLESLDSIPIPTSGKHSIMGEMEVKC